MALGTFLANVITKWGVKTNQSEMSDFKASDLQTAKYNSGFAMSHRMGLAIIDMTTGKSVPSTATWTYDKNDGTYTESGTESSDAHTTIYPYHGFNVTTSSGYSIPLNAATASTDCYYIVKSTSATASTSVKFGCDTEETKEYWTDVTISDIGYGKCHSETIASDREFASLIALFTCVRTCQKITLPWYDDYTMECWGASGGLGSGTSTSVPGCGAYVRGTITLPAGQELYVYVGAQGVATNNTGAWNGGGPKGTNNQDGSGGGATDIRTLGTAGSSTWSSNLESRIIVAGAGGGSDESPIESTFAHAGGLQAYTAYNAYYSIYIYGASQNSGGYTTYRNDSDTQGLFGMAYQTPINSNCGGGSGYYGGGNTDIIGLGGSSFISGHPGCTTVSGYIFKSNTTKMIDGRGLTWTTSSQTTGGTAEQMPTTSGGQEALNTGHSGNGYAKITSL